jgi:hypothetical protein
MVGAPLFPIAHHQGKIIIHLVGANMPAHIGHPCLLDRPGRLCHTFSSATFEGMISLYHLR